MLASPWVRITSVDILAIVAAVLANHYNHFVEGRLQVDAACKTSELRIWLATLDNPVVFSP